MPAKTNAFIDLIASTFFAGQTLQLVLSTAAVSAQTDQSNVLEPPASAGYARGGYVVRVQPASHSITNDTHVVFNAVLQDWAPIVGVCLASAGGIFYYQANLGHPLHYRAGEIPTFYPGTLTFKEM